MQNIKEDPEKEPIIRDPAEIIVIAAVAENNVIGSNGDIPWRIKEDFLRFKDLTVGYPCIMGRKTYLSLPRRPLPGRENIVISSEEDYKAEGAVVVRSFNDAIECCRGKGKAFICGGAAIYRLGLKVADTFELTKVHKSYEGDTFFPDVDFSEWTLLNEDKREGYSFLTYKRKR
jgi:dihydrofolate reductase